LSSGATNKTKLNFCLRQTTKPNLIYVKKFNVNQSLIKANKTKPNQIKQNSIVVWGNQTKANSVEPIQTYLLF